jgi:tryptophan synthase alpha chain
MSATPDHTVTAAATGRLRAGEVIERTRAEGRPALVAYLPVGYPDLEGSISAARTLIQGGVDILELGIPYSDPVMDGSVIQEAASTALERGFRTRHVFEAVEALQGEGSAILVMTYWNPVLAQGVESFASRLAAAGGAGLITPDLIPDEAADWIRASDERGLDRVFLVAPSSPRERLSYVSAHATGFVYASNIMGVTGERHEVGAATEGLVERTRAAGARNVCVGLGVSGGDQAAEIGAYADGVIVGSAFVRAVIAGAEGSGPLDLEPLAALTREIRAGIDRARDGGGVDRP